jgi:hypothetical protein
MQNKNRLFALILMIVLAAPMIMVIGLASAQTTTTLNLQTFLYLNAGPSPVGVGQTVYLTLFFSKPSPGIASGATMFPVVTYAGLKINIVMPNKQNETLGPYSTDTTGGVPAIDFVPQTAGNYTLQGTYPGQPIGTAGGVNYNLDSSMTPAVTLVVQQTPVSYWTPTAMPTSYWTTPIYASNYYWAQSVGGNWYGCGRPAFDDTGGYDGTGNNYQPYSTAPTTSHILWTLPTQFGGQPGGETAATEMSAFAATSPLYHIFEPIILDGVLYYNWYPAQTDMAGIAAVNLFTGQTLWVKNTTDTLTYGQVVTFHTVEEFGSQAFLWTAHLVGITGSGFFATATYDYNILDPVTGNLMATVTNIPGSIASLFGTSTNALIDSNESNCAGSILIYYTNSTYGATGATESLTMWNSSLCLAGPGSNGINAEYDTGDFKPSGTYNWNTGIEWSVPVPNPNLGLTEESLQGILLSADTPIFGNSFSQYGGASAIDMAYNAITGQVMWGPKTQTLIAGDNINVAAIGQGVYVRIDKDTDALYGYSLATGNLLWGPTQLKGDALSYLEDSVAIAYGQVYEWDIGGYLNAVNLNTGKLDWTWTRGSAGYNTPYGVYPNWVFDSQTIADGMIFLSEGRLYDPPLFPGGEKVAINCTTGQLVWAINGAFQRDVTPVADSEMLGWNGYDGQIYAFGLGPSKTTVTAPDPVTTMGTPIVLTGSVTDISPGASQTAVAANFANGLPCVSDASMQSFMQAVYEQQPMPTNVTGVPVTLYVLDSNNNYRAIGTTTTNANGFYSLLWRPDIQGNYTVTATFAGTQSYYGSTANTAFYVAPAATTTAPTTSPTNGLASNTTVEYGIVAIAIIVVIIGAVLALLVTRKRP